MYITDLFGNAPVEYENELNESLITKDKKRVMES